jgi:hypothetical protein
MPTENPGQRIYEQIEQAADFYQPAVYELLSFYHALENQQEPLDGQFIPLTTAQPWEQARTVIFAVGLLPPSSNVSGKLLDRSASVRALQGSYSDLIAENPDVGSSSTGDLPGETGGIATSTPRPVGPTQSDSKDFWVQFTVMCNRLGCQPEELAHVIQSESGFDPSAGAKNKNGVVTAKGLIQLIHGTAIGIGMSEEEYANLQSEDATSQLKWVERFYRNRAVGRNAFQLKAVAFGGYNNPDGSIYSSAATSPAYKQPDKQKRAYLRNAALDGPPPKGYLTPEDLGKRMAKNPLAPKFKAKINQARQALGMATDYTAIQPDGSPSHKWAGTGSDNAQQANKTAAQVANKDLNQTNLGKKFMFQQQAMINQMINALTQMAKTPPLRLLVNPQSFRVSAEKIISDGNWGRNGPIIEHFGDNQDKIEGSGKIAAFYSMDVNNANGPGLTRTARQFSASYQNLLSLWLIYKNNGGIWFPDPIVPTGSKAKNLSIVGSVYLYYDHILYIGSFDNLNLTEADAVPFSLEYSFSFTVRAIFLLDHLDDPQYNYGQPTTSSIKGLNTPPLIPSVATGSGTPPLSGGNNEQPSPEVALPPETEKLLASILE